MNKPEVLALAITASKSNERASALVGIVDESVALAFDMQCAVELTRWEIEREGKLMEAMAGGAVANQLPPELTAKIGKRIRQ